MKCSSLARSKISVIKAFQSYTIHHCRSRSWKIGHQKKEFYLRFFGFKVLLYLGRTWASLFLPPALTADRFTTIWIEIMYSFSYKVLIILDLVLANQEYCSTFKIYYPPSKWPHFHCVYSLVVWICFFETVSLLEGESGIFT